MMYRLPSSVRRPYKGAYPNRVRMGSHSATQVDVDGNPYVFLETNYGDLFTVSRDMMEPRPGYSGVVGKELTALVRNGTVINDLSQERYDAWLEDIRAGRAAPRSSDVAVNRRRRKSMDNGMVGKYVIVRCRDAGVHAGYLKAYEGREALLTESRRLWYWVAGGNSAFLSGVATEGLGKGSKVGARVDVHLTETCEIIECSNKALLSIKEYPDYER